MGVLDKFLNVMRLNPEDDDDFYNEDYDYDDDYTEDELLKYIKNGTDDRLLPLLNLSGFIPI